MLQHIPKGEHGEGIYAWKLDGSTGKLSSKPTAVSPVQPNPAFILKHPSKDIVYASTECINECGEVITLQVSNDGSLKELSRESAGGRSTCYLTLCSEQQADGNNEEITAMGCVNYWDAIVSLLPVDPATGIVSGPAIDRHTQPEQTTYSGTTLTASSTGRTGSGGRTRTASSRSPTNAGITSCRTSARISSGATRSKRRSWCWLVACSSRRAKDRGTLSSIRP